MADAFLIKPRWVVPVEAAGAIVLLNLRLVRDAPYTGPREVDLVGQLEQAFDVVECGANSPDAIAARAGGVDRERR